MNRILTITVTAVTALGLIAGVALARTSNVADQSSITQNVQAAQTKVAENLSHSLVVKIVAKAERSEDVAKFLTGAGPLAEAEDFTPIWFALRVNETTFYVVDAFSSDANRTKHLEGKIAAALMANADVLLAEAPQIQKADILAAKVVGSQ